MPSCLPNFTITDGGFVLAELVEIILFEESFVASEGCLFEIPLAAVEGDGLLVASSFNGLVCVEVESCEFPCIDKAIDKSFEF